MLSFIADLHHVSLNVGDLDRAEAFYVDVLGLTVLPRPDFPVAGRWLDAGAGRQAFFHDPDGNHLEIYQDN